MKHHFKFDKNLTLRKNIQVTLKNQANFIKHKGNYNILNHTFLR